MSHRKTYITASLALAGSLSFNSANAAAPQAPAATGLGGPTVAGICMLSRAALFANAAVGKAAFARLKQLNDAAEAEVAAEKKPLDNELKTYQAEAAKLTPEQRRTSELTLRQKLQAVEAKAQQRSRELEATRTKALQRIADEAQPLIAQSYTAHNCGLLMDRDVFLGGNMANDLTPPVVQALDAKITTITFNREILPAQSAQPANGN